FDVAHALATRLADLQSATGMTQRKLATSLGVSEVYVSRVLHGQPANMTLATIVRFARAMGCRVAPPRIMTRTPEPALVVVEGSEAVRNQPRSWPNSGASARESELGQVVTSPEETGNGNIPSTAA